ncbi:NAD(P)-binding protein [Schizophyllum commune Loenen D]|nr:NAD(P)-binding protein [Schizophyllum commune Loenen D]
MSTPTVYLVSGANRGLGLGLVKVLLERPDAIVFAGARNPDSAKELKDLAAANPSKLHIVKLVSSDKANNDSAAEEIRKVADHIDVVIANAAIGDCYEGGLTVPAEEMARHFDINVNGPLVLFQATYELLKASKNPKFVGISTPAGSITAGSQFPGGLYTYGSSKAALSWVLRKLHHDFENIVTFPISPGAVDTDMGALAVEKEPWLKAIPMSSAEEASRGVLKQIDEATREKGSGQFLNFDGQTVFPW